MLSIIISSYQPNFYDALEKNIAETCGVEYEIIKIENKGKMGICEAYNIGAAKSQYENLLFLHEDVLFHTKNWGAKLLAHLKVKDTGIIGLAGSSYVPAAPCGWNVYSEKYNTINIIQNIEGHKQLCNSFEAGINLKNVFAVDGVFLSVKKKVYEELPFSEELPGFHGYDLDFSLRIAKKYQNFVCNDILLEHFSQGNPNEMWFRNNIKIRKKNGHNFDPKKDRAVELQTFLQYLRSSAIYDGIKIGTMLNTAQFLSLKGLGIKGIITIFKQYYNYFKYKADFQKKFQNES